MGRATTRTGERLAAAVGLLDGAPIEFELMEDVPDGGVLFALPALLQNGLLTHSRSIFSMPEGFYPLESIFLLLALMTLCRIPSLEALRYQEPGEWGNLLGLDRIPEVRTLRRKISALCSEAGRAERWSSALARDWMNDESQSAGVFYVDGHVRLYHGQLTDLPRRYVTRERLCLRGTTDYWVNAMNGNPFFVVTCAVDPGLLTVLREQILPRLLADVPHGPSAEALAADPLLHRFTIVFDREGYSPDFSAAAKAKRIAVISYHKFPEAPWPEQEFSQHTVTLVHGEEVVFQLAERGTCLSNGLWVREVRRRSPSGHQTAILSTDYRLPLTQIAPTMFARWCQENFFKYMRAHFGLDRLIEYGTEPLPDTTRVVNPSWRDLDHQIRKQNALLVRQRLQFADLHLPDGLESNVTDTCQRKQAELQQTIIQTQAFIEELKAKRKAIPHHVTIKDLPPSDRFSRLRAEKKHFIDTIKLIAYRAETSSALIAREKMTRLDDARSLLRQIFNAHADIIPDHHHKTLTIRLHPLTTQVHDTVAKHLADELTATETIFPGTSLKMIFQIAGSP